MKYKCLILLIFIIVYNPFLKAQTYIKAGNINGVWSPENSPYIITGDINIPIGQSLVIHPGVIIKFKDSYVFNVQGSLVAIGTCNDSIRFTISDTLGYVTNNKVGWNGIHFDIRDVRWDTIRFELPGEEEYRIELLEKISKGLIDTSLRIKLSLAGPDLINDESLVDRNDGKTLSKISFCKFEYTTINNRTRPYIFGGAIYIYRYRNLEISNSSFNHCRSYAGGAIYCKEAAPAIVRNTFQNCYAVSSGGAMVFIHSGAILADNKIQNNRSGFNGGGILFYESCPFLLNNTIIENSAFNTGGGIYTEKRTTPVIISEDYSASKFTITNEDNTFRVDLGKESNRNIDNSNGRYYNNIICNNKANNGGGIGLYAVAPEFINNTISNNTASSFGGGFYSFFSAPVIANSIIYGNKADNDGQQIYLIGKTRLSIYNSDLEADVSGISKDSTCKLDIEYVDNINATPLFVDQIKLNFSLGKNSPCIDAGNRDTSLIGITSLDIKGSERVYNNIIDIGALEYALIDKPVKKSTEASSTDPTQKEPIINLYPNPNNGEFSISVYNNPYSALGIVVFAQSGLRILEQDFTTESFTELNVDLKGKPSGLYIVQVIAENEVIYKNVFIIK